MIVPSAVVFMSGAFVGLCIGLIILGEYRKINKEYEKDLEKIHNRYLKHAQDRNLAYAKKLDEIKAILNEEI